MNFDMMLFTESGAIGLERKKVPDDLLSSVSDGRLNREILAMREETNIQILLLHGKMKFNKDGSLKTWRNRPQRYGWTKKGITNLLRTICYVEGLYIEEATNNRELVQVINDLQKYFDQKYHLSIKSRSRIETSWLISTKSERIIYFYSGLPGIKAISAKKLLDKFPYPLQLYEASIEDLCCVPGIGKVMATGIYNFLRGING